MLIHLGLVRGIQTDNTPLNPERNLAAATTRNPLIDLRATALL